MFYFVVLEQKTCLKNICFETTTHL